MRSYVLSASKVCLSLALLALFVPAIRAQGDAEKTYKSKCVSCHAADGSGSTPAGKAMAVRDLRSPAVQKESDAEMAGIISNGKNKMPKYAATLKDAEIKDLVAYIRGLAKK
jgi:mono/diheme cytochrome c family protein